MSMDAIDVAPGKKTTVVASAFAVAQALAAAGVIDPATMELVSQGAATLFGFTLLLKARRAARKAER
jgi:hypothetical protein